MAILVVAVFAAASSASSAVGLFTVDAAAAQELTRHWRRQDRFGIPMLAALRSPRGSLLNGERADTLYVGVDDTTPSTQKMLTQPYDIFVKILFLACFIFTVLATALTLYSLHMHWRIGCRMSGSRWPHERASRKIVLFLCVPLFAATGFVSLLTLDLKPVWEAIESTLFVFSVSQIMVHLQSLAGGPFSLQERIENKFWSGEQYKGNYRTQYPCCFQRACMSEAPPSMTDLEVLRNRFKFFQIGTFVVAALNMALGMEDQLGVLDDSSVWLPVGSKDIMRMLACCDILCLLVGISVMNGMAEMISNICPSIDWWHIRHVRSYGQAIFIGMRVVPRVLTRWHFVELELTLSNGYTLDDEDLLRAIASALVCFSSFLAAVALYLAFPVNEASYPFVLGEGCDETDVFIVDRIRFCPFCGSRDIKYTTTKGEPGEEAPPQAYMPGIDTFDCPKCRSDCIPLELNVRRGRSTL